jgi:uncharacterized flavoprotein (TIGR03862 family)
VSSIKNIAIIGGGPAGLRAAEVAAAHGATVTLYDAKRSVGRKFLVAGKSGLNLTNSADFGTFVSRYSGGEGMPDGFWNETLADFDADALRKWAAGLGIETFSTTGGKVFPVMKKAAPLLRRWVERLRGLGVQFAMNHRWTGIEPGNPHRVHFENQPSADHHAVILALGGASWPQTGSDGRWTSILAKHEIAIEPLRSANCGWEVAWTETTRSAVEGQPLHNLHVRAGNKTVVGELMLTRYGIQGTCIYQLGRELRAMEKPELIIDFKPTFTTEKLIAKMESARRDFLSEARVRWKLAAPACAMVSQMYGEFFDAASLASTVKECRIPLTEPRPIAEAISSAGGVAWCELDQNLMLRKLPGIFCCGEMLDWEAPTGGFLLQGCFATGVRAAKSACRLV